VNKRHDTAAFVAVLTRYAPSTKTVHVIASDALGAIEDAERLQAFAVHACNRELTKREVDREKRVEERLKEVLAPYGVTEFHFGGDPRGSVVKLRFRDGETRGDWGGEGLWCL
jgi:hypothetical protein